DRPDMGINLKAPKANEKGKDFWGYSFLQEVTPGDLVFHYDKNKQAIVARSVATGKTWSDLITWAARGTSARAAGIEPHLREGLYLGLESYSPLENPVTLEHIRKSASLIDEHLSTIEKQSPAPLYFPFERGTKRATRPMQGYLFKLPAFFLQLFPSLNRPAVAISIQPNNSQRLGLEYRRPPENQAVAERDPFAVDPSIIERGLRGHAVTQNQLADALLVVGLRPRSSAPNEPSFDMAWKNGSTIWVAEVKSTTDMNEEKQLRLGLGQVLRYAYILSRLHHINVRPVLVVERKPVADEWIDLCATHDVLLLWPPFNSKALKMAASIKPKKRRQ
ncbi:MAG TPA: hypothetical protein VJS17_10855, partial [Pyrinomonadaceae bacterium]|nr:hypothetical protein [Pyrinomonadaceae bacterium]